MVYCFQITKGTDSVGIFKSWTRFEKGCWSCRALLLRGEAPGSISFDLLFTMFVLVVHQQGIYGILLTLIFLLHYFLGSMRLVYDN